MSKIFISTEEFLPALKEISNKDIDTLDLVLFCNKNKIEFREVKNVILPDIYGLQFGNAFIPPNWWPKENTKGLLYFNGFDYQDVELTKTIVEIIEIRFVSKTQARIPSQWNVLASI